jgi:hypothetical protein
MYANGQWSAAEAFATPINGTITLSSYEGSELRVARLLIESSAKVLNVAPPAQDGMGRRRCGMA